MKRRGLTLGGSVVGTVLFAILSFASIIQLPIYISAVAIIDGYNPEVSAINDIIYGILIPLLSISLVFYITCLILNACAIPAASADHEGYNRRRGLIITAVVFDFLTVFFSFGFSIFQFVAYFNPFAIFSFLFDFGIVAAAILLIVDLCKEKSRAQNMQPMPAAPAPRPAAPAPAPRPQPQNNIDAMAAELGKLNELKTSGIISEEEYNELKHKILLKY